MKLSELLTLRERMFRARMLNAPVGALLREVTRRGQPAWCIVVSAMHRDAEAVLTGLHDMERGGVRTRLIDVRPQARRRNTQGVAKAGERTLNLR